MTVTKEQRPNEPFNTVFMLHLNLSKANSWHCAAVSEHDLMWMIHGILASMQGKYGKIKLNHKNLLQ